MSLSEARSQVCQFLTAQCPADLKESPAAALEGVWKIEGLSSNLDGEADWPLAALTRGPNLRSRGSPHGDYGRLSKSCSVVIKSVPSLVVDSLSLAIHGV